MRDLGGLGFLAGLVLLVAALVLAVGKQSGSRIRLVARPLTTPAERRALALLEAALPGCRIYAQVAMGALLRPEHELSRREYWRWRWRFSQKIVDFVAEERTSGRVMALIELDDRSHDAERDAARDRMTAAAGYRTIRLAEPTRSCVADRTAELKAALWDVPA